MLSNTTHPCTCLSPCIRAQFQDIRATKKCLLRQESSKSMRLHASSLQSVSSMARVQSTLPRTRLGKLGHRRQDFKRAGRPHVLAGGTGLDGSRLHCRLSKCARATNATVTSYQLDAQAAATKGAARAWTANDEEALDAAFQRAKADCPARSLLSSACSAGGKGEICCCRDSLSAASHHTAQAQWEPQVARLAHLACAPFELLSLADRSPRFMRAQAFQYRATGLRNHQGLSRRPFRSRETERHDSARTLGSTKMPRTQEITCAEVRVPHLPSVHRNMPRSLSAWHT